MPLSYANYKYSIFIYEVKYPKNSLFKLYTFCYKRNVCENVCIAKDMKFPSINAEKIVREVQRTDRLVFLVSISETCQQIFHHVV